MYINVYSTSYTYTYKCRCICLLIYNINLFKPGTLVPDFLFYVLELIELPISPKIVNIFYIKRFQFNFPNIFCVSRFYLVIFMEYADFKSLKRF